jgi:hypothetical protein
MEKLIATDAKSVGTTTVHPLKSQTLDQLTILANEQQGLITGAQRQAALHAFRAGEILVVIRKKLGTAGGWCQWQRDNKWNRGTAAIYVKLFLSAKSSERLKDVTLKEAITQFCKPKKKKPKASCTSSTTPDVTPVIKSPTAQSLDLLGEALEAIIVLQHGERHADPTELQEIKKMLGKFLDVVAGLEAK